MIGHEGGFVNHPSDPGGATNYGITQRSYPGEDIRGMTLDLAKEIYRRDYWGPAGCDAVPDCIKFDLFDMAVNAGVSTAIRALQSAVMATPDGVIGPRTLMGLSIMSADALRRRFAGLRLEHFASLPTWPAFGRGWVRRVAANLLEA